MSTLTIRDLSHQAEMDRDEMSAVRGGMNFLMPFYSSSAFDLSGTTEQLANQTQNTFNQNGLNAAFASDMTSNVKPKQDAHNVSNINMFTPFVS
ncbi:hypothetical protein [Caballeronia sp. GAFFF2]|uniref:hypothetical protein n=1 Tax=Caballeronia sp. GAFFF2 TaxID=2921741 RepID=UPI00202981A2|nr:hypothetical protein [Caballeronia sp. GAFFF2]